MVVAGGTIFGKLHMHGVIERDRFIMICQRPEFDGVRAHAVGSAGQGNGEGHGCHDPDYFSSLTAHLVSPLLVYLKSFSAQ
jgi:hypothetical protein